MNSIYKKDQSQSGLIISECWDEFYYCTCIQKCVSSYKLSNQK